MEDYSVCSEREIYSARNDCERCNGRSFYDARPTTVLPAMMCLEVPERKTLTNATVLPITDARPIVSLMAIPRLHVGTGWRITVRGNAFRHWLPAAMIWALAWTATAPTPASAGGLAAIDA